MTNDTPILSFRDLRIEAGPRWAPKPLASGISFDLAPGRVLGLIGESGAGKSTIGLAALGYARPGCRIAAGQILLQGEDLLRLPERRRLALRSRRIAYVAQSAAASFNPARRLGQQCIEMALRRGMMDRDTAERRMLHYFERFSIPDPSGFARRFPHQVSGGQLQRAMVAMALIGQPAVVVFDEPTTALDVTTQIGVVQTIRDALAEDGLAGIYISHDLALMSQIADDIIVLKDGRIVEAGPRDRIVTAPQAPYTRSLLQRPALARAGSATGAGASPPEVLAVERAVGSYGRMRVLSDVSISLARGRSLALIGESGSGKSTLARAVTGLFRLESGRVSIGGSEVGPTASRDRDTLRRVQLIHQYPDTALNPRQRVGEAIGRALDRFEAPRRAARAARIAELLRMVELPAELAGRYPAALSGGQKQRVCIARALAARPEILVCDEVTASLDRMTAEGITTLLNRLKHETGMSSLVITHDISLVAALADDVAVMQLGRVVEAGPAARVLDAPEHPYTRQLIAAIPTFETGWLDKARRLVA